MEIAVQVDGRMTCPSCGWPVCQAACSQSPYHLPECTLLANSGKKPSIQVGSYLLIIVILFLNVNYVKLDAKIVILKTIQHSENMLLSETKGPGTV